ncbi:MAG TPA: beta-ketoacyl-ACP synthase 3 [Baekduia sp.]|nr:beta-ketoacyl-ACP synthase 3 [Baekduia sp.]
MSPARAGILSVGTALPKLSLTNEDLARQQNLDTSDEWIIRRTGIKTRHRLSGDETLTSIATLAAKEALEKAGKQASDIDHLFACTVTPDQLTPGLAPMVAGEIGAPQAAATDLNAACSGFIYALDMAIGIVESGRADLILIVAAEALSRITDHDDRGTAVLFGDGAGAVVVAAGEYEHGAGRFIFGSNSSQRELLYADRNDRKLMMRGREVYRAAVANMVTASKQAIEASGLTSADVDMFFAHQANARIIETAAKELGIPPEKVFFDVDRSANTSAASIPLALGRAEREGALKPGMTLGLTAFGAGFVWGAGIIRWREPQR